MAIQIFDFKTKNRVLLAKCATLAVAILCFGVFYHPSPSDSDTNPPVEVSRSIPASLRRLGSTVQQDHGGDDDVTIIRAGACKNVDYANQTYQKEIDQYSLPLNELMIHLDRPAYVSPPNPNGPTIVDIGLYVHKVFNLDPVTSTFEMEGYLDLLWCDPHTKFDAEKEGKDKHMYLEHEAERELEEIWWPDITFVNEQGRRETENQEVIVESDGTVEYREKFKVMLSSKFDLRAFPFDKQVLRAEVESFVWNSEQLLFHVEEDLVGFSDDFEIPEQKMTHVEEHLEIVKEARDRHPFSELVTQIYVTRNPSYYVTKVCIPLGLIVAISWSVFWLHPTELADRMAISFTGVLSSVAYQFVVADIIPRHASNVFLANFVLVTFLMQVLIGVENVVVRTLFFEGHPMVAKMVDRICRVIVPLFSLVACNITAFAQVMQDDTLAMEAMIAVSVGMPAVLIVMTCFMVRRYKKRFPEIQAREKSKIRFAVDVPEEHTEWEDEEEASDELSARHVEQFKGSRRQRRQKAVCSFIEQERESMRPRRKSHPIVSINPAGQVMENVDEEKGKAIEQEAPSSNGVLEI